MKKLSEITAAIDDYADDAFEAGYRHGLATCAEIADKRRLSSVAYETACDIGNAIRALSDSPAPKFEEMP